MALIKCPECGKKFSEHADFCPNCGYKCSKELYEALKKDEHTFETSKLKSDKSKNKFFISGIALLILGVGFSLYILFWILMCAFREESWYWYFIWDDPLALGILILALILIFLSGILMSKKTPTWKKYSLYLIGGIFFLIICGEILNYNKYPSEAERAAAEAESQARWAAQEEERKQNAEKKAREARENPSSIEYYYGTWQYKYGSSFPDYEDMTITINEDGTAVMKVITKTVSDEDVEHIFYGSWYNYEKEEGKKPIISFDFTDDFGSNRCRINGDEGYWKAERCVLNDGYLYMNYTSYKAKNPNTRVKITKIK